MKCEANYMINKIKIGTRIIGENERPLVIAELGMNHEGSLKTAFEMVDAVYEAGAEVIKHQTPVVEDEIKLKEYVESKRMIFISAPFSRAVAERLERMAV